MIRWSLAACFLAVGTYFAPLAVARDLFVDNKIGDDRRDGSSPQVAGQLGGPFRSITRALRSVQAGDRVVLARNDEPYRESITLQAARHSGTPQQPFELVGNGAVLDGSQPISAVGWEHVRDEIFRARPVRMSYQMLYLGDRPAVRRPVDRREGLPPLDPLEWCLYDRHLYFRAEAGKLPGEYSLACSHLTVGITLYDVHHVVLRDLIVQGFQLDGVNAHDGVAFSRLQGLICRGNGRSGISVGGACRIQVTDSLVGDNGTAQVRTEGQCRVELSNCQLLENTAPALVRDGGEISVTNQANSP